MNPFLEKFFPHVLKKKLSTEATNEYCQYDSLALTSFTSSLYLAALVSSLLASHVTRKFGRRLSMFFGGVFFFSGAILNAAAAKVWMLIVGRILLGLGIGFSNQACLYYAFWNNKYLYLCLGEYQTYLSSFC